MDVYKNKTFTMFPLRSDLKTLHTHLVIITWISSKGIVSNPEEQLTSHAIVGETLAELIDHNEKNANRVSEDSSL